MRRHSWTFRTTLATAFLACLLGACIVAHADSVTYSKVVTLQLQGTSNTDTVGVPGDNATLKFDSGLNYFATKNDFKLSLKTTAIKDTPYDVYLKAFILYDNSTTNKTEANVDYFVYDNTDPSGFPVLKLQTDKKAFLEDVQKSQTIEVLKFPIDDATKGGYPVLLQAIAVTRLNDNCTGMDAKMFFWNWLDTNPQP